jgi:heptosyltransferase III
MAALFYHCGALGDFLTVLPVIRAWRMVFPGEKIVLLGRQAHGTIARGCVDEVWEAASVSQAWLFSDKTTIPENARSRYCEITSAVLFAAPQSPIVNRLRAVGVKNIYSHAPFPDQRISAVEYHLALVPGLMDMLDHFGPIVIADPAFKKDALLVLDGMDDYIVIHPGSGSAFKNWPFDNFKLFAENCHRCGLHVLWIYGEAESDLPEVPGSRVVRGAPLPILVHLLAMSKGYLGNDSGISHLAAATGRRSMVLFGPSDDVVWGPRGAHVTIVKARHACAPCHPFRDGSRQCENTCMQRLSVEAVFEAFLRTIPTSSAARPTRG